MRIWKLRAHKPLIESDSVNWISKTDVESGKGTISFASGDYRVSLTTKELERIIQHHYADHRFAHQVTKEEFREMVAVKDMTFGELRAEVIARRMKGKSS